MLLTAVRIIHWILTIGLITVVIMQPERSAGFSSMMGGASEGIMGGRRRKGIDALLAKLTVYLAIGFVVSAIMLSVLRKGTTG